jgi:type I restriction-modification system DNA methylase subunit
MSLFQKSVEQKYLKQLDNKLIAAKYNEFKTYFGNPEIQENIRNSKEEQFQEGFLCELFVKILGYTLNPNPDFNLTTEYKNIKDCKKADGAIIIGESVKAAIELKGTNTTDLGKIETQAFGYKNNQPDCVYVITSNFEKLRFYIDNAIEFIEFNLFKLTKPDFEILYICLAFDQIAKGIPKKVKDESLSQEDAITKKLYSDYSLFKRELHQNLVSQNPEFDALTLFRKSQKLLDRFLFLFFAEDRQLLPPNSVRLVLNDWKDLQERDEEIPLYNRFKKYFGYLNTGFKGKRYDVFAYNGGLFKPDEILDKVTIDDALLYKHALKLSEYDFASEVDVNILGHIFENSLNELDEIQAQLDGREIDKAKTKRKKDGVFYTPKYITKYIVENTLGKLCAEKKDELLFNEEDYTTDKKRQIKTKQALLEKLKTYQNWLLQLTICDPACGSGAFLNQALDFLMNEHRYIDELQAKLLGVPMILSDVEKSILENNLFGVDLNEESVEIAKLSLWLRTAQPNRKLNDLSNNIKCGNSLISDPAVAGDKAFDWEREFPQVFAREKGTVPTIEAKKDETPDYLKLIKEKSLEAQTKAEQAIALSKEAAEISKKVYEYAEKLEAISESGSSYGVLKGGFDVVIGNPPYGILIDKDTQNYYTEHFPLTRYKTNLYVLFIERMMQIFDRGVVHFIIPKSLLFNSYYADIRKHLIIHTEINEIYTITEKVFDDAEVGGSLLLQFTIKKKFESNNNIKLALAENIKDFISGIGIIENKVPQNFFLNIPNCEISVIPSDFKPILDKLNKLKTIGHHYSLKNGLNPGNIKHILISDFKNFENHKPIIWGKDISPYSIKWSGQYVNYDESIGDKLSLDDIKSKEGMNKQNKIDFALRSPELFERRKIVIRKTGDSLICCLDESNYYFDTLVHGIYEQENDLKLEFLLALINSRPATIFYRILHDIKGKVFAKISLDNLSTFPIPNCDASEIEFLSKKAKLHLPLTKELQEASQKFQRTIQRKFDLEDLPGKLQNWYLLSYKEFIAELSKKKVKLSLTQEAEWEDYFLQEAKKVLDIKAAIETTDKEIDQMVYQLYGLTAEEIRIVEGA